MDLLTIILFNWWGFSPPTILLLIVINLLTIILFNWWEIPPTILLLIIISPLTILLITSIDIIE